MKYFIGYRYDRTKKDIRHVKKNDEIVDEEVDVQFSSYSSDVFECEKLDTLEDIQALEKQIWDTLLPEIKLRNQELIGLLILGIYKLEE